MSEPVSPADTIRRLAELCDEAAALQVVDPNPANLTVRWEELQDSLVMAALYEIPALLAVGERDKAEIEARDLKLETLYRVLDNRDADLGKADRQIARLTEALADLVEPFQWLCKRSPKLIREMPTAHAQAFKRASEVLAAVLAGEEDAPE